MNPDAAATASAVRAGTAARAVTELGRRHEPDDDNRHLDEAGQARGLQDRSAIPAASSCR